MNTTLESISRPVEATVAPKARGCAGVFFVLALLVASSWGAGLGVFLFILQGAEGTIQALDDYRPKIGSKVYSADSELLGEFAVEARQLISLNEMPLKLQKAFLATEDDEFYQHKGVRPLALVAVAIEAARTGNIRGASTITQQIVRNIDTTGISKDEQTIKRKFNEMLVALQVEREFTKDEILEMYLNQIFLGISAHGVQAASQQYFNKSASDLTLSECAVLAGLTRSPNRNNPLRHPENARIRRDIVLAQMLENGFITQSEHDEAVAINIEDSVVRPDERERLLLEGKQAWNPGKFKAPYFVEEVRKFISTPPPSYEVRAAPAELLEGGLEIHTSIDMRLQRAAEEILIRHMDEFDATKREYLEKRERLEEFKPVHAAIVCLDNRPGYEGFIRAMVGGRNFDDKKFNDATQAARLPGSSVKPMVWLAALDHGMTPSDIVVDEPTTWVDSYNNTWTPKNFDSKFMGAIPIRVALERSINIVSVKLVDRLGFPLVRSYMQDLGFRLPIRDEAKLTIALGTEATTVLDQAVCYQTLALGGVRATPTYLTEIVDRDGFPRYDYRDYRKLESVIKPDVAYQVVHLLEGVCTPGTGAYQPTGTRTSPLGRPRGGKTGTTNDSKDVWFCGITPDFTCVVWFGYEDNTSLGRGLDFTGGRLACPVWTEFMIVAHEGLPVREFDVPSGVEFYNIERTTGLQGGNYKEAYIRGTKPPTELPLYLDENPEKLLESL